MTSTLLLLVFLADPLLGDAGIATAKVTGDKIELTLSHGHDAKAVSDAIKEKIPEAQVSGDGPLLSVSGASLEKLKTVEVNEPGPGNLLAMEAPTAGGSIRVARAMDMPQDDMVRAKVVSVGKGDAPMLKLKRVAKSRRQESQSDVQRRASGQKLRQQSRAVESRRRSARSFEHA